MENATVPDAQAADSGTANDTANDKGSPSVIQDKSSSSKATEEGNEDIIDLDKSNEMPIEGHLVVDKGGLVNYGLAMVTSGAIGMLPVAGIIPSAQADVSATSA